MNREVLQYMITCQNTYVICRQALRQVLVLQRVAALWLDVKPKNSGCGLAPSSKQRKVCPSHPSMPKSKRWGSHLTTKRPRWEKILLRWVIVARPELEWFTYQDNVESRDRTSAATLVRFLHQDNVLQNLANVFIHYTCTLILYTHICNHLDTSPQTPYCTWYTHTPALHIISLSPFYFLFS